MSNARPAPQTDSPEADNDERQMRRALGLSEQGTHQITERPDQLRHRPRPGQDSQVVVETRKRRLSADDHSSLQGRLSVVEAALAAERAAHSTAARALEEAQTSLHSLQTKLAHAEMSFAEALATERRLRAELQQVSETPIREPAVAQDESRPVRRRRSKPFAIRATEETEPDEAQDMPAEPEPIKWWIPGQLAKARKAAGG